MKPDTRAMVAFAAGELILRKNFSKVYDYSSGHTLTFNVSITEYEVEITETRSKAQLNGGVFGKHYSLTHQDEQALIKINVAGSNFDGEHSKGPRFKGFVKDNIVTLTEGSNRFVFGLLAS